MGILPDFEYFSMEMRACIKILRFARQSRESCLMPRLESES
ncbi:hypothetical protein CAter282_2584 [Collimonas arenae]|uniref:Uncharacterized protein n=1 Tax=Collimonas arenae TaxID=279058 RepID=A0A127PRL6_9BURK|nr:hypothetical protein CAter10_2847 [Collimonas arenae]AMP10321.1 hypothetical protein CAter282_2584 [Collimonas arenae]